MRTTSLSCPRKPAADGGADGRGRIPELSDGRITAIDPEQSFTGTPTRSGSGVDEYAVAAGYMGMVEFTIPQDVYSALLK